MSRYAQLVIGPAGSGKSTYCYHIQQHCNSIGRSMDVINLDPAAEDFRYSVAADVRELVSLEDVMEEENLGPNGGLIYCMEYLQESMDDWLAEKMEDYIEDDYVLFDCPGQIELYTHLPVFKNFVEQLRRWDFNVCAVYLIDSQFVSDVTKYISGCLSSLAAMIQLEVPHVNVLTKMDLVKKKKDMEDYLEPDAVMLLAEMNQHTAPRFGKLNQSLAELIDDYRMVNFVPLDVSDEDSLQYLLSTIDSAIQYGENSEVKMKDFDPELGDGQDFNFDGDTETEGSGF